MILKNATVYIAGKFSPSLSIRLQENQITAIGTYISPIGNEKVVDCNSDYIIPGFVDVHIHGYMGNDTMQGEKAIRKMAKSLKKTGVAAFLPTTMSASAEDTQNVLKGVQNIMKNPDEGASFVLGAHLEAPFLALSKKGAQLPDFFIAPSKENYDLYTGANQNVVRMITLAPELEGGLEFIREYASSHTIISLGHSDANSLLTHEAAKAGASQITHLFNAQSPIHHREPGMAGAALVNESFFVQIICDGVHLHPDIIRLVIAAKGKQRTLLITDAMEAAGLTDGEYRLGSQKICVKQGAARLESGTLAGSTLTMEQGLKNLIKEFHIDPETSVWISTTAPADSINEKRFGRIEIGRSSVVSRWSPNWEMVNVYS